MATELVVRAKDRRLIPASQIDWEVLDGVRQDVDMACKLWMPRSLPHQRWYRALVSKVAEGLGIPHQLLHEQLKIKAGLYHISIHGEVPVFIMRSTSFESMDQIEFAKFTEFALMTILTEYLPDIRRRDLIRDIDQMAGVAHSELLKLNGSKE